MPLSHFHAEHRIHFFTGRLSCFLLHSDAAEDGDGDGAVGTSGNSSAENVTLKFVCAHLSGVVIVRKRGAINLHRDLASCRVDAICAEQAASAKGRIFVLLECALGSVVTGEFDADVPEDLDHVVAVGSKHGHAVWLSSIVGDASAVREDLIRSDELPITDKEIGGTHLSMHGGNSQWHGNEKREDASGHECTVPSPIDAAQFDYFYR